MREEVVDSLQAHGVHALRCLPDPDSPVVILAHGINADLTEDRSADKPGLFDCIVERLSKRGIGTVRFDFRGHGKSDPVDGYVSISSEVEDLNEVIRYVQADGLRLGGMIGCSFGACAASVVVANRLRDIPCLVLVNPVVRPYETFIDPGSMWARASVTEAALKGVQQGEALMLDGEFPLGMNFVSDVSEVKPVDLLSTYPGRLAVVHGTSDTYVPFEYSRDFARSMGCTFIPVDGSEHGFGRLVDRNFVADMVAGYIAWTV